MTLTFRTLLLLVAVVLFILVAIGVRAGDLNVTALGLAAFAAAFLVPDRVLGARR